MHMQPGFRAFGLRCKLASHRPEIVGVVHVHEMGDFMCCQIIEDMFGCHDQAPGEIERARCGA